MISPSARSCSSPQGEPAAFELSAAIFNSSEVSAGNEPHFVYYVAILQI